MSLPDWLIQPLPCALSLLIESSTPNRRLRWVSCDRLECFQKEAFRESSH